MHNSRAPLLPPAFRDRVHPRRQLLMGQFRVDQATQWRADSVHFRESAGTGIVVVLKMAHIMGYIYLRNPMDQMSLFFLEAFAVRSRLALFIVCCVFSSHSFWTSSSLDVPAGVTREKGHTGIIIHLLSAVRAFIFLARRIQPFLSFVDREVELFVLMI